MHRPSRADVFATPADRAACRQAIRQGSRSFHRAGQLLPVEVREPAFAVYAFCRMADDLVDREAGGWDAIDGIERCLDRVYAGRPRADYVERAFTDVVNDYAIPRAVPDGLVEGLRWDAGERRYETLSELKSYAVRVASSVGVMMSLVMQRRQPEVLARACDLGIAMQLTNICRDVGEDRRAGRCYLPREFGDADADPGEAVARLLAEAEFHYDRAAAGIAALPSGSRTGINAARFLYREIGRLVAAGVDPVHERAVVPLGRKLALLAMAAALPPLDADALAQPCAPEAAFLVDAVMRAPAPAKIDRPRWWDLRGRAVRMVELLAAFDASARREGRALPSARVARGGGS
jgi:15-cis-phytoene synthase